MYTRFVSATAPQLFPVESNSYKLDAEDKKCGLGLVNSIKENLNNFSLEQQAILKQLLARTELHTSIVTESGLFRIHYDTTGINAPRYISSISAHENALYASAAIDSAYNFEVTFLGYPPPPPDFGEGGDDLYDIYIINLGDYGRTIDENVINEQQQNYTSFIEINNEFGSEFFTHGIDALQVTMAHELHHAIQFGYINRVSTDRFFYEMTSTAMEEFVFDSVNDYYSWLLPTSSSYFQRPETPLSSTSGYNSAIWMIFLKDVFGYDIIKREWEMMKTLRAMIAISQSLFEYESTFTKEFNKFAKWCYFTNYRSIPGTYFEEAPQYPLIDPTIEIELPSPTLYMSSKSAAHTYITLVNPNNNDTLVVIVSNGDAQSTIGNNPYINFDYTLFANSSEGSRFLTSNYSSDFNVDNPGFWSVTEILNNIVVREDSITTQPPGSEVDYAYPSPFYYDRGYLFGNNIFLTVNASLGQDVDFNVYTSSMELIVRRVETVVFLPGDRTGLIWNVLDDSGGKLASGIYIYTVRHGDEVTTGKIAIFN